MALTWMFVLLLVCGIYAELEYKKLAGPPSEFQDFETPDPISVASIQHSAIFQIHLSPNSLSKAINQQVIFPIDSKNEFRFHFFSPFSDVITLSLSNSLGKNVPLHPISTFIPIGDERVPGTAYIISRPVQGEYVLDITATLSHSLFHSITTNTAADVYIILWNEDAIALHTSLNTYKLIVGQKIGLISQLIDNSVSLSREKVKAMKEGFEIEGDMNVVLPNGKVINQPMTDDNDLYSEADDGIFSGLITATMPGLYTFSATLNGTNADGIRYIRTTTKAVHVVDASVSLTGAAYGSLGDSKDKMIINIAVTAPIGQKYHVFAQVWGQQEVPISWIGGMAVVKKSEYGLTLALELDFNWLSMANYRDSLILRNVSVKDPSSFVAISEREEIAVESSFSIRNEMNKITLLGENDEITTEMREGKRTNTSQSVTGAATVILVHGYCSTSNPWEDAPAPAWSSPFAYFKNYKQTLSNDEFAYRIGTFGSQFGAFSAIAHSQGGMAILHLYTYYFSGLDNVAVASGKRLLQSVGTPYRGCALAGNLAAIGNVFGAGCGTCYDLTKDGAQLWLNTIPTAKRQKVFYYTTTYKLGNFFGDYCNLAANSVLSWPNDGTTEFDFAQLSSGNNMGNTEKQCHVSGMSYMAQTSDKARNTLLNSNAAR